MTVHSIAINKDSITVHYDPVGNIYREIKLGRTTVDDKEVWEGIEKQWIHIYFKQSELLNKLLEVKNQLGLKEVTSQCASYILHNQEDFPHHIHVMWGSYEMGEQLTLRSDDREMVTLSVQLKTVYLDTLYLGRLRQMWMLAQEL